MPFSAGWGRERTAGGGPTAPFLGGLRSVWGTGPSRARRGDRTSRPRAPCSAHKRSGKFPFNTQNGSGSARLSPPQPRSEPCSAPRRPRTPPVPPGSPGTARTPPAPPGPPRPVRPRAAAGGRRQGCGAGDTPGEPPGPPRAPPSRPVPASEAPLKADSRRLNAPTPAAPAPPGRILGAARAPG